MDITYVSNRISLIIGFVLSLFLTAKSWQCTMNVPHTFICLVAEFRWEKLPNTQLLEK